jgi:hypothetical protein
MENTLYLGAEYLIVSKCELLNQKYELPCDYLLKDSVTNVLGDNWIESESSLFFIQRLKYQGIEPHQINEPVLYGKLIEKGGVIMFHELLLLSEVVINYTLKEYDWLIKNKRIVELKI